MSDEKKSLGQVAFEAWSNETWEFNQGQHHRWERAAQAVVASLIADMRSPQNDAIFAAIKANLKAQGAAEERERLAKVFEEDAGANRQTGLTRMVTYSLDRLIAIIRSGGKP